MTRLFISYSRQDREFADRLAMDLRGLGADLWMDVNRIRASQGWNAMINDALKSCDMMLLIVSKASMASEVVRAEYESFLESKKPIIPILWQLAETDYRIQRLQYVDFRTPYYNVPFCHLHAELNELGVELEPLPAGFNIFTRIHQQAPLPLKMEDMVGTARHTLWISGAVLDTLVSMHSPKLAEAILQRKVETCLLLLGLDPAVLEQTSAWLGTRNLPRRTDEGYRWFEERYPGLSPEAIALGMRVRAVHLKLRDFVQQHPSDLFQVKTFSHRPSMGYLIVDHDHRLAQMTVAPYFFDNEHVYNEPPGHRSPHLIYLSGSSPNNGEQAWFRNYVEDFKRLWWNGSVNWDPTALD